MSYEWMERAACLGLDPALFFPPRGPVENWAPAKEVCASCPVTAECLNLALVEGKRYEDGIYGGLTGRERRRLKRRMAS